MFTIDHGEVAKFSWNAALKRLAILHKNHSISIISIGFNNISALPPPQVCNVHEVSSLFWLSSGRLLFCNEVESYLLDGENTHSLSNGTERPLLSIPLHEATLLVYPFCIERLGKDGHLVKSEHVTIEIESLDVDPFENRLILVYFRDHTAALFLLDEDRLVMIWASEFIEHSHWSKASGDSISLIFSNGESISVNLRSMALTVPDSSQLTVPPFPSESLGILYDIRNTRCGDRFISKVPASKMPLIVSTSAFDILWDGAFIQWKTRDNQEIQIPWVDDYCGSNSNGLVLVCRRRQFFLLTPSFDGAKAYIDETKLCTVDADVCNIIEREGQTLLISANSKLSEIYIILLTDGFEKPIATCKWCPPCPPNRFTGIEKSISGEVEISYDSRLGSVAIPLPISFLEFSEKITSIISLARISRSLNATINEMFFPIGSRENLLDDSLSTVSRDFGNLDHHAQIFIALLILASQNRPWFEPILSLAAFAAYLSDCQRSTLEEAVREELNLDDTHIDLVVFVLLLLGKKKSLSVLLSSRSEFASSNWKRLSEIDVESTSFTPIAQKNAFSALSKRLFSNYSIYDYVVPAVIFFLLANDIVGSISICLEKMDSASLALLVAVFSGFQQNDIFDEKCAAGNLDSGLLRIRLGILTFREWIPALSPMRLNAKGCETTLSNVGLILYGLASKSLSMSPEQRKRVLKCLWDIGDYELGDFLEGHWIWRMYK